jgi:hypothetical protein
LPSFSFFEQVKKEIRNKLAGLMFTGTAPGGLFMFKGRFKKSGGVTSPLFP